MKTRLFRRPAILCLLTCLFATSVSLGAQGLYSDPDNYHLVSEWRLAVNPTALREFQEVAFELQYGPPRWFARLRAGASVNAAGIPAALVGIEVPLLEADSENSNVRGWGLYLRGSQCLDSLGRPITEVGFGGSASLFGLSGPGIVVAFGSDRLFKFSLALLTGCATTLATTTNGKLAYAEVTGTEKGSFVASERGFYVLGFIGLNKPQEKLDTVIEPKLAASGANAAKNLKVVYHADFLAFLINSVSFGLIQLPNIEVSGTAVAQ